MNGENMTKTDEIKITELHPKMTDEEYLGKRDEITERLREIISRSGLS